MSDWYIYDPPDPVLKTRPDGTPFASKEEAEEFANLEYPEDESGGAVVVRLPDADSV